MSEENLESEYVAQFPEFYMIQDQETGGFIQIVDATYHLLAPCYLGDSYWFEGEPITTELTPNYDMQPLNKAAARRMEFWVNSLPDNGEGVTIQDTTEAAHMLRNHPSVKELSHEDFSAAVLEMARKLKVKRTGTEMNGGRGRMTMPQIDARRRTSANIPAMKNLIYRSAAPGGGLPRGARV